jgi:hypothetical protein
MILKPRFAGVIACKFPGSLKNAHASSIETGMVCTVFKLYTLLMPLKQQQGKIVVRWLRIFEYAPNPSTP